MGKEPLVVGIGELLWDVFSEGKKLGGAPLNFTYHCVQLGAQGQAVSALGADADGEEIRRILESKKPARQLCAGGSRALHGRVNVTLEAGKPSYEICRDVAWDHIRLEENLRVLATRADAVASVRLPTEVVDTVGAGDSFTARLCLGLLQNLPLAEINRRACQVAAFFVPKPDRTSPRCFSAIRSGRQHRPQHYKTLN